MAVVRSLKKVTVFNISLFVCLFSIKKVSYVDFESTFISILKVI